MTQTSNVRPATRGAHREGTVRPRSLQGNEEIALSGLTKLYEPTPRWMRVFARTHIKVPVLALDHVDLRVCAGEICAIVGPNGAGKTTLFRIIVGLTEASGGSGLVHGYDISRHSEQIRRIIGWMPSEDRSLLMRATCTENLNLHGRLQGMQPRDLRRRVTHVLEAVDLCPQAKAVVASLSAGMKARLRLARALLPGPRVLILDEPTGAIDPIAAHRLLDLIMRLVREERLAVLISSHRLEEIEALRSRALLLDGGRVKYSGDLNTLREQWQTPRLELSFDSEGYAAEAVRRLARMGLKPELNGATVLCVISAGKSVGDVLTGLGPLNAAVQHVHEIPMPLRDLIARVYQADQVMSGGRSDRHGG